MHKLEKEISEFIQHRKFKFHHSVVMISQQLHSLINAVYDSWSYFHLMVFVKVTNVQFFPLKRLIS